MISRADYEPRAIARVEQLLDTRAFTRDQSRLRAEDLLREVNPQEREELRTLTDSRRQQLKAGAYLLRATALTLDRGHPRRREYLRIAAEMFEDLAGPAQEKDDRRTAFQALSQAAACWSLAGYQANAVVMGDRLRRAFLEFDVLTPAREVGAPGSLDFYAVTAGIIERDLARLEVLVRSRKAFLDDVQEAALEGAAEA